jgi:hypothetical protein
MGKLREWQVIAAGLAAVEALAAGVEVVDAVGPVVEVGVGKIRDRNLKCDSLL